MADPAAAELRFPVLVLLVQVFLGRVSTGARVPLILQVAAVAVLLLSGLMLPVQLLRARAETV
jgi:hypothetical protein